MGLGILPDKHLEHVPGTANVLDGDRKRLEVENLVAAGRREGGGLKYDASGQILLVPQPSDDARDPLNWSLRKRDTALAIICLTSIFASTLSPLLAANTVSLALHFHRDLTDMALLTGYHLLGVALGGIIFVPSARIWGKRHLYLLGCGLIIVSCIWAGATGPHYASFLWARIVQGIGLAPFEALVNASVGDMYHVHERGVRMAISNFCVFGGAFFTPVLVGVIADRLGYEWTFYFVALFMGVMVPFIVLFAPETAFRRETRFDIDTMGNLVVVAAGDARLLDAVVVDEETTTTPGTSERAGTSIEKPLEMSFEDTAPPHNVTLLDSLMPFNGRKSDDGYLHLLLRPFPIFFHPGILWSCLIQGTLIGFTVLIGIVLAGIMLGPPLWFGEVQTGYMYTGAFLGALIGFALAGIISDPSASFLTRINNGIYEPEFRMVLVIPQVIFGGAGLIGFGWTSAEAGRYGWIWPDFFFGCTVVGMVCGAVGSALYVVDAHRDMSVEAFTCLLVFKNVFSFALTFKGFDWIVQAGSIKQVFVAVGCAQIAVCALTIPMYIFGKKNRSFFHRHNVFFNASDWIADKLVFW
ncbi:MFS transporter-like protein [Clathrospora elynae]|uniref:MFS transporter-like protein n=1 Tax=Clathrospora elynae TaxID=706981 RepID=A0A6A5SMM0_9PLEO|nr:MFS transporter-like protein [Clathrospora elynae]